MAKKRPATRKRATPKTKEKTAKAKKKKGIELRPMRRQLAKDVKRLEQAISAQAAKRAKGLATEESPELVDALAKMKRWQSDIQSICGSDMMIPIR